jgi:hypothetical protein
MRAAIIRVPIERLPETQRARASARMDEWISIHKASLEWGISEGVIRHWLNEGLIPSRRRGRIREMRHADIAPYAEIQATYGRRAARVIRPADPHHAYISVSDRKTARRLKTLGLPVSIVSFS